MKSRGIVSLTAAAALLAGGEYAAATPKPPSRPKPVCQQIVDPPGDAAVGGSNNKAGQPQYASLDVLSVDLASGRHKVAAVLRLKTLTPDPYLPTGATYQVSFTAGATTYNLFYRTFLGGGPEFNYTTSSSSAFVPIDGTVDPASATVTILLPRTNVPELKKPGVKLTDVLATTSVGNNIKNPAGGVTRGNTSADHASRPGYSYLDLTPTCVKGT